MGRPPTIDATPPAPRNNRRTDAKNPRRDPPFRSAFNATVDDDDLPVIVKVVSCDENGLVLMETGLDTTPKAWIKIFVCTAQRRTDIMDITTEWLCFILRTEVDRIPVCVCGYGWEDFILWI
jgi:hypothetical protein